MQLDDLTLVCIEDQEPSQGSVEGPTAFDLLTKQIVNSTLLEDTGDSQVRKGTMENQIEEPALQQENLDAQAAVMKRKPKLFIPPAWPRAPPVSEFRTEAVISSCRRGYVQMLWNNLKDKITKTPLERMPSLEKKADEIMEEMCSSNIMDLKPLQSLLKTFFANVAHYDSAKSALSEKIPVESYNELLSSATQRQKEADLAENELSTKVSSIEARLAQINNEKADFKK